LRTGILYPSTSSPNFIMLFNLHSFFCSYVLRIDIRASYIKVLSFLIVYIGWTRIPATWLRACLPCATLRYPVQSVSTRSRRDLDEVGRDFIFWQGSAWLGGTLSFVSARLLMRLDFRPQCWWNWSTRAIFRVVEVPLNPLFECRPWRHWMFVVPF
jgi:hypothetical protein